MNKIRRTTFYLLLTYFILLLSIVIPFLFYYLTFSPVLTTKLADHIANISCELPAHILPLTPDFFMLLAASKASSWQSILLVGTCLSFLFLVVAEITFVVLVRYQKMLYSIATNLCFATINLICLISTYSSSYIIFICPLLILTLAIIINGFSKNMGNSKKLTLSLPAIIPFAYMIVVSILSAPSFSFSLNWKASLLDRYKDVTEYLTTNNITYIYTQSHIDNYLKVATNNKVSAFIYDTPSDCTSSSDEVIVLFEEDNPLNSYTENSFAKELYNTNDFSLVRFPSIGLFNNPEEIQDLSSVSKTQCDSIFLSLVNTNYTSDMYDHLSTLTGLTYHNSAITIPSLVELRQYMKVISENKSIKDCIIRLNPYDIYRSFDLDNKKYYEQINESIANYVSNNPELNIHIEFPTYCITEYQNFTDFDYENIQTSYSTLMSSLSNSTNCDFHYYAYPWLYENEYNYNDNSSLFYIPSIANYLLVQNYGCNNYIVDNPQTVFEMLERIRISANSFMSTKENPLPKDSCLVVLGDSIFGNYNDASSIQDIIENYSSSSVICEAIGGTLASAHDEAPIFGGQLSSISDLKAKIASTGANASNLIFIIEFGLNDYLNGAPLIDNNVPNSVTTYSGALKSGIEIIKDNWPQAAIIVIAPGYTTYYNDGQNLTDGVHSIADYRNEASDIASLYDAKLLNFATDIDITQDTFMHYSDDGVHYNHAGRMQIAKHLIELIHESL